MDYSLEAQPRAAEHKLRELIRMRLASRTHWIFLPSLECITSILRIEDRFYRSAPSDFQTYILPVRGAYEISLAAKRRMNACQLAAFLNTEPLSPEIDSRLFTSIDLMQHDVIVLASQKTAGTHSKNFYQWLGIQPGGVP